MQLQHSGYARGALVIIVAAALYRLIFIFQFGPGPDEAFYWEWTRPGRLSLGYVEHPPLVAYLIWIMSHLLGAQAWAWRLLAVVLGMFSAGFVYLSGKTLFDARVGFWAVVAFHISPVILAMGGLLLPESLLGFWMTLALYLSARLVRHNHLNLFLVLGVVFGGALLSKLPAVLIPAALGLFAILSPRHRDWFRRPQPYAMVLIGLAMFTPVLYWNATHEWAGLQFVQQRTTIKEQSLNPGPGLMWQSFMAQAGYHSPLLYFAMWLTTAVGAYRAWTQRDPRYLLLLCFSAPVMILFQVFSAFRFTLPHWPLAGYLATYIMVPAVIFGDGRIAGRWTRRLGTATVALGAIMCLGGPVVMLYPLTTVAYHRVRPLLGLPPEVIEPMAHAVGWDQEVREGILRARRHIERESGQAPVVLTHFHMLAGLLAYHLRDVCEVASLHAQAHQYDLWFDDRDLENRAVLFVSSSAFPTSAGRSGRPEDYYVFDQCTPLPGVHVTRSGVDINRVDLWWCRGYGGPAATPGPRI